MSRVLNENWITSYLRYTQNQESPEIFHLWSAISIIAAALRRKVFFDKGHYIIYPNFYIGLIGPTAVVSKTTAAEIAVPLLMKAVPDIVLMQEKATPWAVYDWLNKATMKNGEANILIYAPEMRTFLSQSYREEVITLLTSLYGCPDNAPYITKQGGISEIKNVSLNILACSTPEWLMTGLTGTDIGGGFTGRWMYIYADFSHRCEPFPEDGMTTEKQELYKKLGVDLGEINNIKGQFIMTDDAKRYYENWYNKRRKEWKDERLFGYYARKRVTVYKLAMILSIAEDDSLIIDMARLKLAFELLTQAEKDMPKAFSGVTFSESTKFLDRIMNQIEKEGKMKFSKLARMNQHFLDSIELERVVNDLVQQERIRPIFIDRKGKKWIESY